MVLLLLWVGLGLPLPWQPQQPQHWQHPSSTAYTPLGCYPSGGKSQENLSRILLCFGVFHLPNRPARPRPLGPCRFSTCQNEGNDLIIRAVCPACRHTLKYSRCQCSRMSCRVPVVKPFKCPEPGPVAELKFRAVGCRPCRQAIAL